MSLAFYTRYAFRALLRDGQRTLLAILCIGFGVMSLIALQLLSNMVHDAVVTDPRASLGGDAMVMQEKGQPFTPQEIARLEQLRADGTLAAYSLILGTGGRWLKPPGTGQVYFLTGLTLGVDPAAFPLVGAVHLREPSGVRFGDAIKGRLDAVITSDLADKLNLKVGDTFTLIDSPSGVNGELSLDDIRVLPLLRSAATVKGLRFPRKVHEYFETMMDRIGYQPLPAV